MQPNSQPVFLIATSTKTDVRSPLEDRIGGKLIPTYGPGGDWLRCSGGWHRGGDEFLWSELIVSDEAVCGETEVGQELDEQLVPV